MTSEGNLEPMTETGSIKGRHPDTEIPLIMPHTIGKSHNCDAIDYTSDVDASRMCDIGNALEDNVRVAKCVGVGKNSFSMTDDSGLNHINTWARMPKV